MTGPDVLAPTQPSPTFETKARLEAASPSQWLRLRYFIEENPEKPGEKTN